VIVLHLTWIHDGVAGQETYGPFLPDDDDSHLEMIATFMREWTARTGYQAAAATLALVTDPVEWVAAHPPPPPARPAT
jgi:hypothetical protein